VSDKNTLVLNTSTREMHLARKAMWDASMSSHQKYLDPDTHLFANVYVEVRKCPACDLVDYRFLFNKSGGSYVACTNCRMIYLNPVFKDHVLEGYYRNNHTLQGETVAADNEFYKRLYMKGLESILRHLGSVGTMLDVGCSTGSFLDLAKLVGWKCHGLELNKAEAKVAKAKGHIIQESVLSKCQFDERFDCLTLWDVFEHIKDGVLFLNEARKYLRRDALIFLQAPSGDALAARLLQAQCNMFDGLEHVNIYGRDSLTRVCDRAGYEVVSYETVIAEIGVMNNYINYEDPYLGYSNIQSNLFDTLDESWIHERQLGYKFQACLRIK
jgi:hypothetical protein